MEVKPEKLFIILPFDESSKKIIEALNNDTARKILEVLSEEALSTSQIAEKLNLPLTTVQYNVKKLLEAKLIKVKFKRFSEKRREVEYYEPSKKLIVILPERMEVKRAIEVLKKALYVACVLMLAGGVGMLIQGFLGEVSLPTKAARTPEIALGTTAVKEFIINQLLSNPWLWMLGGAVITLLFTYAWRKLVK